MIKINILKPKQSFYTKTPTAHYAALEYWKQKMVKLNLLQPKVFPKNLKHNPWIGERINQWVFIGHSLPKPGVYLATDGKIVGLSVWLPFYDHWDHSEEFGLFGRKITHWMSFPLLPQTPDIWFMPESIDLDRFRVKPENKWKTI